MEEGIQIDVLLEIGVTKQGQTFSLFEQSADEEIATVHEKTIINMGIGLHCCCTLIL